MNDCVLGAVLERGVVRIGARWDLTFEQFINPETGEPSPYVTVRDRMRAKIVRPVYYELVDMGLEETFDNEKVYGVWGSGEFFPIGTMDPDG